MSNAVTANKFVLHHLPEEIINQHKKDIADGYYPKYISCITKIVEGTPHAKHLPEILQKIVHPYLLK
jgi:hypothetical protein